MGNRQEIVFLVITSILILSIFGFFEYSNAQIQIAKLRASDAAGGDGFGRSVSISGDRVIVGAISDSDFTSGIQFMIKENIISIPDLPEQTTETAKGVPDWVRNNAGWWADGLISDDEFVNGIKYLVERGIIGV